jgi:hypothetical protein
MKARHEFTNDTDYENYLMAYFAAMAMQGMIARYPRDANDMKTAVAFADALLKQLKEK